MSENYRLYRAKKGSKRVEAGRRLQPQLAELLGVVARCEAMWALEDRIKGSL